MFSGIQLLSSEIRFRNFHICWDISFELDFDFLDLSKVCIYDIGMLILRLVSFVKVICKVNNVNGIRYNKRCKNINIYINSCRWKFLRITAHNIQIYRIPRFSIKIEKFY